ncbi:MAG: DUF3105 domain-containing protein [Acidimicrobiales bacterium]
MRRSKGLWWFLVVVAGCSTGAVQVVPSSTLAATTTMTVSSTTVALDLSEVEEVGNLSRDHTPFDVDYATAPPSGGDHFDVWHNCGVYSVELHDEMVVHTLEHGMIWVTYLPSLSEEKVLSLAGLFSNNERLLMSPYPEQLAPVVVTSWGRRLEIQEVDDPRILGFVEAFTDAEDSPEPGVSCTGGLGVPPDEPFAPAKRSGVKGFDDGLMEAWVGRYGAATFRGDVS